uniref:Uncharacterized protein n=1 Tax=Cyclophora tenuis TaxID=216820 RepID=A0A6U1NG98_CYCTE|mmetsp:Transcript_10082/g.16872  ORF Transcript_10082/g.16872 Transcript_10082/m.16872 type:complete len:104 (+) Transcript_10082:632-943(+)
MDRRSCTGYVMFLNSAMVNWYSKKQGLVEGATFGSEFMAMKTAAEVNRGFRYKLNEMQTGYINTLDNVSDLMTKPQPRGERRERLLWQVMWDIHAVRTPQADD